MIPPSPIQYHIYTGAIPNAWPYAYVLAGNGLFKVADTPHFRASTCLFWTRVSGLAHYPEMGVLLRVPKIPRKWLIACLDHARLAARDSRGHIIRPIEQMYHFHWWPALNGSDWRVSRPRQEASGGAVTYRVEHEASVVLDLHSHHGMAAYFSDTDDRDEQGCRFYAVIGRIFTRPEIRLRLGIYGDFIDLPARMLFEDIEPFVEAINEGLSITT